MWFAAIMLAVGASVARRPEALLHPNLYAEDGPIFLRSAYLKPAFSSVTEPYNGYLHLLLRVWAEITTVMPVTALALSYALFSFVVAGLCYSIVLSTRMRWLVPSDLARSVMFIALVLLPGTSGVTGNLTNALWPIGVGLGLLSLSDSPRTSAGRMTETCVVALMGLTGATVLLVAPSFVLRYRRTRTRHDLVLLGVVAACATVQAATLLLSHQRSGTGLHLAPGTIARAALIQVWGTLAVGEKTLARVAPGPLPIAFVALCLVGVALSILSLRLAPAPFHLQWLSIFGLALGSTTWAYGGTLVELGYTNNAGRYFLLPMVLVVVGVVAGANRLKRERLGPVVLVSVAAVFIFAVLSDFRLAPVHSTHWAETARCIRSHRTCRVESDPDPFSFNLPPIAGVR